MAEYEASVLESGYEATLGADDSAPRSRDRGDDAVVSDQEEAARLREFRLATLQARKDQSEAAGTAGALESAVGSVQAIEELALRAKRIRTLLTAFGALTAASIYAAFVAILLWNGRLLITLFGGGMIKQFAGLSMLEAAAVFAVDLILVIVVFCLFGVMYAVASPIAASCELGKSILGDGTFSSLLGVACKPFTG